MRKRDKTVNLHLRISSSDKKRIEAASKILSIKNGLVGGGLSFFIRTACLKLADEIIGAENDLCD